MDDKALHQLAKLDREQLIRKLDELEQARRIVIALIRACRKTRRKVVPCAAR
jgi:hypothetical protein